MEKFRGKDKHSNSDKQGYIDYLNSLPWDYFITGSTAFPLTLPSLRRQWERWYSLLFNYSVLFWVGEKFECRDGYHGHGLLKLNRSRLLPENINYGASGFDRDEYIPCEDEKSEDYRQRILKMEIKELDRLWQLAAGNHYNDENEKWDIWHQIDLKPYMKGVGAHGYCAKYINKKRAEYDLLTEPIPFVRDPAIIRKLQDNSLSVNQDPDPRYRPRNFKQLSLL
jgi:hypothetical protein